MSELDHPDEAQPKIESYVVDKVVNQKSGRGPKPRTTTGTVCVFEDTALRRTWSIEQTKFHNVKK